jgi:hypothetical protein
VHPCRVASAPFSYAPLHHNAAGSRIYFPEQQRIVVKVDELMAWCDELETHLKNQQETATRFAAAIAQP